MPRATTADQRQFAEAVVTRRRAGESVPEPELIQAAAYLGFEGTAGLQRFKQIYKGSVSSNGMDFKAMLPEQVIAIVGDGSATHGMFGSAASPLHDYLDQLNQRYGHESGSPLSRGQVRKLLNKAKDEGRTVTGSTNDQGLVTFQFEREGRSFTSNPFALDDRAARYLTKSMGSPRNETLPASRQQNEDAYAAPKPEQPLAAATATADTGEYTFVPPVSMSMDPQTINRLSGIVSAALDKPDAKTVAAIEQFLQASGTAIIADGKLSGAEAAAALNRIYGMSGKELSEPASVLIQALPAVANPGRER